MLKDFIRSDLDAAHVKAGRCPKCSARLLTRSTEFAVGGEKVPFPAGECSNEQCIVHTSISRAIMEERRGKAVVDLQKENATLVKEKERLARDASEREASLLAELEALRKKKTAKGEPEIPA